MIRHSVLSEPGGTAEGTGVAGAGQVAAYLEDTYLMEVATQVSAAGRWDDGAPWVAVRRNVFHPQGGGQPADRGWLGDCEVVPFRDPGTGLVAVRAHGDGGPGLGGLSPGDAVRARVDPGTRLRHAALHTAGHLIEAAGRRQGWVLAGNVHFPGQARIEFTPPDGGAPPAAPPDREAVAARLRAWVAEALAATVPVTAEQDTDGRRVVRLGDLHAAPCGGTHVRSLADLAEVTISAVKVKKGRIRVSYEASHRPWR